MASGYINLPTEKDIWEARLAWNSTQIVEENSTSIQFVIQIKANTTGLNSIKFMDYALTITENDTEKEYYYMDSIEEAVYIGGDMGWVTIGASSYFKIPHKSNGTKTLTIDGYIFHIDEYFSTFNSIEFTLPRIRRFAYITSATNFNEKQNPSVTYANPNGATNVYACISTTGIDDIPYRPVPSSGTYTFKLTQEERETLINSVTSGSGKTVTFYIRSVYGGVTNWDTVKRTFTLTDANPDLAPVAIDMNTVTSELTGNYDVFIKGYSDAACQMNATGKYGATISSYKITNGSNTRTDELVRFVGVTNPTFTFSATDSRGNTSEATITKEMIDYFKPSCKQEVKAELASATEVTINIQVSGRWFNKSFGAAQNTLKVEVKRTLPDGTEGEWEDITSFGVSNEGDNFTLNAEFTGYPYAEAYDFQCRVTDALDSAETTVYTVRYIPVFDWSKEDFNFNVPVSFQGDYMADFVIEQGTEAMGSNGTWHWTKWKSGKAECYGVRNYGNTAITTTFGNLYRSASFTQDLPFGLFSVSPDFISITPMGSNGEYGTWVNSGYGTKPTANATGEFQFLRPASATISALNVGFHILGRWK